MKLSELVSQRIERMRLQRKLTQEAVAEGAGLSRSNYVRKTTAAAGRVEFSVDQADACADYFRRVTGRRLTGWPFVDEATADSLDKLTDLLASHKRGT